MSKLNDILGINARSAVYLRLNPKKRRRLADDKLRTKKLLAKFKIPHPRIIESFSTWSEVSTYEWPEREGGFVIKPVHGLGGAGILIIKRKSKQGEYWLTIDGKRVTAADMAYHVNDILEGGYSRKNDPDKVLVEERVKTHPRFVKLAYAGAPDVRVIVFNNVPVMAMLRIPTEESGGKANLHQGAIGLGIDIATGITTYGVHHDKPIKFLPDGKKKVNGIVIPDWDKILATAVAVQMASGLGYMSVDFLLDENRGPLVLELNDQPGLSIQIANGEGLKKRLERVSDLTVDSVEKGVRIAKTLFASNFVKRIVGLTSEKPIIGLYETAKIRTGKKKVIEVKVKIDSGATMSSIDEDLARELNLLGEENILLEKEFRSALGKQTRKVVGITVWLKGRKIVTSAGVTKRERLGAKLLLGRKDLSGFMIDPTLNLPNEG